MPSSLHRIEGLLARVVTFGETRRTAARLPRSARHRQDIAAAGRPAAGGAVRLRDRLGGLHPAAARPRRGGAQHRARPGAGRRRAVRGGGAALARPGWNDSPSRSAYRGRGSRPRSDGARTPRRRTPPSACWRPCCTTPPPRSARGAGPGCCSSSTSLHTASADEMSVLLNALQNLDGERAENPLAVVAAGLPVTPEALTRAATFGERSTYVSLDVLSADDARAALVGPAEAEGVGWSPAALSAIVEESKGYPYLIQAARQHHLGGRRARPRRPAHPHRRQTWSARRPGPGSRPCTARGGAPPPASTSSS
ncbi:hypothetical protein G5V59_22260 [Nocardioides sp. W3-2-3]|uniref:hypothetical protein n=1 Tax=Nocardioides convexus TaxID=2712224 RepID=UPI002418AC85|nr:hypothetical protein [Nocardioides convexus]NHA01584.1 hypothetical protein [Nocardioides convexus]